MPVIIDRAGRNFNADETDGVSGRDNFIEVDMKLVLSCFPQVATTRAPVNTHPGRRARATGGRPSSKRRRARVQRSTAPCRPDSAGCCAIGGPRKRWSPWRTPSCGSPIMCWPTARVYRELGGGYYDRRHRQRVTRRAIHLLEHQGYRVILEPACRAWSPLTGFSEQSAMGPGGPPTHS
jgi:hypothetical protein